MLTTDEWVKVGVSLAVMGIALMLLAAVVSAQPRIRIEGQSNAVLFSPDGVRALEEAWGPLEVVNCAVNDTFLRQHLPGTPIYADCITRMPHPDVIIWMQGESDGFNDGDYSIWADLFTTLVGFYRRTNPDLKVVFAEIGTEFYPHWKDVRDQQRLVQIPGVTLVETIDLPKSDTVHFTPESEYIIGKRVADLNYFK